MLPIVLPRTPAGTVCSKLKLLYLAAVVQMATTRPAALLVLGVGTAALAALLYRWRRKRSGGGGVGAGLPAPQQSALGWNNGNWHAAAGLAQQQAKEWLQPVLVPLASRSDESVIDLQMMARLMVGKYKNRWRGHVLMKDALSLHTYSVLMERQRTRTIFDLGTAGGGSAVWFATQARAMGLDGCTVVTIDIVDQRTAATKEDMTSLGNITFLQLDLCDAANLRKALDGLPHPWMISEDCHVDAEIVMTALDDSMLPGDYIVYEDTHPCTPDQSWMDAEDMANYKHGSFAPAKLARMYAAMGKRAASYMVDAAIQDMYGYNGTTFINSVFVKTEPQGSAS